MMTQGGSASLTVTAPSSTCTTSSTAARVAGSAERRLVAVPTPGHHGHGEDEQAHQGRGPAVADLDQGREVERGEPLRRRSGANDRRTPCRSR